ncbi:hypothetical protein ACSCB1_22605 [Streptomyces europaeiscabiei]|uniref:Lipoprotein n=1 Tax=Streptomyces europaeiscabiei TaxID=146819 RepID=A0ABU4NB06_9ACTN|nr:hypothetical protein [Streptomyces europaeiscabiei]MDX2523778.1 hypothetical protein [Streptomyces europaeiscabiei]MDX3541175.1 hypothetical protein [Streptomyces europaeiscabiei]MDX3551517.1 hypothetical protein [Streptomyces europaeiscabiei]MDX3666676.1 hypothetical protein [Streptomyces europaeiscabiei]MDX3699756.1 hypothetical protein [Streptomyces europaeiscabiei]
MGPWRRVRAYRTGGRRLLLGAGLGIGAVLGLVACEGGGLNTGAVAFTTDQLGTKELERQGLDVQWLTCTASYDGDGDRQGDGKQGDGKKSKSPSASVNTVANVDCTGEDKEGRDITLTGKVTKEVDGRCVRGDLRAKVGGKEWFHVDVLGNCDAPDPTPGSPDPDRPGPTVTVTVTQTIWCQKDPACLPEGK